jgi:hypothetical protein
MSCTKSQIMEFLSWQVRFVNGAINAARPCTTLLCNVLLCPCYTTLPATSYCTSYCTVDTLAANALGPWTNPLIPCFINCNTKPTVCYEFKDSRLLGIASTLIQQDCWNGSRLYEVNLLLLRYRQSQSRTMSLEAAARELCSAAELKR